MNRGQAEHWYDPRETRGFELRALDRGRVIHLYKPIRTLKHILRSAGLAAGGAGVAAATFMSLPFWIDGDMTGLSVVVWLATFVGVAMLSGGAVLLAGILTQRDEEVIVSATSGEVSVRRGRKQHITQLRDVTGFEVRKALQHLGKGGVVHWRELIAVGPAPRPVLLASPQRRKEQESPTLERLADELNRGFTRGKRSA